MNDSAEPKFERLDPVNIPQGIIAPNVVVETNQSNENLERVRLAAVGVALGYVAAKGFDATPLLPNSFSPASERTYNDNPESPVVVAAAIGVSGLKNAISNMRAKRDQRTVLEYEAEQEAANSAPVKTFASALKSGVRVDKKTGLDADRFSRPVSRKDIRKAEKLDKEKTKRIARRYDNARLKAIYGEPSLEGVADFGSSAHLERLPDQDMRVGDRRAETKGAHRYNKNAEQIRASEESLEKHIEGTAPLGKRKTKKYDKAKRRIEKTSK